ncbi:hypothetical protein [Janibacter melonis]|uniref:hypothetical protein n=1 Tax=Janibacter melonis TaxID=262209 RepID=UPI00174874C1|nr:hypothetical protein [Janibacter melonis]
MSPAPRQRVLDHLIADGTITEQGVTRTARNRHCRSCRRIVLAAITDLGIEIALDPPALTPLGELQAHTAGVHTYAVLPWGEMVRRTPSRITHRDAAHEESHAQHECVPRARYDTHPAPVRHNAARDDEPPY